MRKTTQWPVYAVWHNMLQRCVNPRRRNYANYGGRGVQVCAEWRVFENFLADMGEPPPGHQIERKNNQGHYTPDNCYWATRHAQTRNKRNNVWVTVSGERMCLVDALAETGMCMSTIYYRVNKGMSYQQALDTPVRGSE